MDSAGMDSAGMDSAMNRLDRSSCVDDDAYITDVAFRDALDVARFAERAPLLRGRANCESWHLDRDGRWVCGTNGTARDSLRDWSADPERLVRSFLEFRLAGTCTPNWVVVDERARERPGDDPEPSEADVEHFLHLRHQLEVVGITLMDAVVFDGADGWWSMCELLTGSTAWGARPFPESTAARLRRTA